MDNGLKDRALGSLMGVFIGDVLGLPVECQSPYSIREKFGYLDHAAKNMHHPFTSVAKRSAGTISDDSQLTLSVLDSILETQKVDANDLKQSMLLTYDGKWGIPVGWGKTTRDACLKIKNKEEVIVSPDGAGNGPVIKIAPLAIYFAYKCKKTQYKKYVDELNPLLLSKCKEITFITHGNLGCVIASYCHVRMLIRFLQNEAPKESLSIAKLFISDCIWAEEQIKTDNSFSERMQEILFWKVESSIGPGQNLKSFDIETSKISTMICSEKSSYIYNSYPLVAYCAAKYLPYRNFKHSVLETVNAGADADSNASMVGALIGASLGISSIPIDMIKSVKNWKKLYMRIKLFEQSL